MNWSVGKSLPSEVGVWVEIENLSGKGREVKQVEPKFNLMEFKPKRNKIMSYIVVSQDLQ